MSARLPVGELFEEHYRIDGVLGAGGYGVVYAARDMRAGRDVALKVLSLGRGQDDHAAKLRFQREIEIVGRLQSPHTVRLFGHAESEDGAPYAMFERIEGRDLVELLADDARLDSAETIHILRQVLLALDEAHRLGLLHRDIKPENIRIDERSAEPLTVRLLDFGIARFSDGGHPSITRTGELIGTPRYMSPEQLTEKELGPESDIYGLGIVGLELAMGRAAIGGTWADQLDRLRSGHVFSMPELERIEPGLLEILQRMTARKPSERFAQATDVLDALDALGSGGTIEAKTVPLAAIDLIETQRRDDPGARSVAILAVVAVVLVVGVIAVFRQMAPAPNVGPAKVPRQLLETAAPTALHVPDGGASVDVPTRPDVRPDMRIDVDGGSAGCGYTETFGGREELADGLFVYVPKSYDPMRKTPLVVLLHQTYEPASDMLAISGFEQLADEHGFVVAAPQHADWSESWKAEGSTLPTVQTSIAQMSNMFCIDRERVYVVSNGHGGFAAMLASCEISVAGTAIHSYGNSSRGHHCFSERPEPHLLITPTESPHVPFNGGNPCSLRLFVDDQVSNKMSVAELEEAWRERNGCRGEPEVVHDEGGSTCRRWNCKAPFQSCVVVGGNGWTGSSPRTFADGPPCDGPPATEVALAPIIWSFFEHADGR